MVFDEASLTVDTIKDEITGGHRRSDFWAQADKWLDEKRRKKQVYYWRRSRAILRKFRLLTGAPLPWQELTVGLLKKFDLFMSEELGNSANTRREAFKILRTVVMDAVRESTIAPADDPFYKFKRPASEPTFRAKLTRSEIQQMESLGLKEGGADCLARDVFLLAFYLRGGRFGDIIRLKRSDMSGGRIAYTTGKTFARISIPVTDNILGVIERNKYVGEPEEYIFPQLRGKRFKNQEREVAYISSVNAALNKSLKRVAEKAGISKSISLHVARHTFAHMAKTSGVSQSVIQSSLKHKLSSTTDRYLKELDDESLDESLKVVYNDD